MKKLLAVLAVAWTAATAACSSTTAPSSAAPAVSRDSTVKAHINEGDPCTDSEGRGGSYFVRSGRWVCLT